MGHLSTEDEKELDRKLGNFYTFNLCGQTYKINHCIVARAFIAIVILSVTFHIIWLVSWDLISNPR